MDSRGIPIVIPGSKYSSPRRNTKQTNLRHEIPSSPFNMPSLKNETSLLEVYDSFADACFQSHYNHSMLNDDARYNVLEFYKSEVCPSDNEPPLCSPAESTTFESKVPELQSSRKSTFKMPSSTLSEENSPFNSHLLEYKPMSRHGTHRPSSQTDMHNDNQLTGSSSIHEPFLASTQDSTISSSQEFGSDLDQEPDIVSTHESDIALTREYDIQTTHEFDVQSTQELDIQTTQNLDVQSTQEFNNPIQKNVMNMTRQSDSILTKEPDLNLTQVSDLNSSPHCGTNRTQESYINMLKGVNIKLTQESGLPSPEKSSINSPQESNPNLPRDIDIALTQEADMKLTQETQMNLSRTFTITQKSDTTLNQGYNTDDTLKSKTDHPIPSYNQNTAYHLPAYIEKQKDSVQLDNANSVDTSELGNNTPLKTSASRKRRLSTEPTPVATRLTRSRKKLLDETIPKVKIAKSPVKRSERISGITAEKSFENKQEKETVLELRRGRSRNRDTTIVTREKKIKKSIENTPLKTKSEALPLVDNPIITEDPDLVTTTTSDPAVEKKTKENNNAKAYMEKIQERDRKEIDTIFQEFPALSRYYEFIERAGRGKSNMICNIFS